MTKKYIEYKTQFDHLDYLFRLNLMNDSVECNGDRLTDIDVAEIESKMFDCGYKSAAGIKRNFTRLAKENSYHPLKEWMNDLVWEGQDIFRLLMNHLTFEHQAISERFFWRFLLGCVGKVMSDGWEQNVMFIIDGEQGMGKSHLSGWLIPDKIKRYFVEGGLEPSRKDAKIRVISNFLWEVGELQGMTKKAELEALKNIITQREINVRVPYGSRDIIKPITCSFIGTVNENGAGFLSDNTGNRRFATTKLLSIDWDYTKLNSSQLWAQVIAMYQHGERGQLTAQEKAEQAVINSEYDTLSHVEQILLTTYDIDTIAYQDNWMPVSQIIGELELHGLVKSNQRLHFMELSGILIKAGCGKSRKGVVTGCGRAVCYSGLMKKKQVDEPIPGWSG